jgi:hypothetical protein
MELDQETWARIFPWLEMAQDVPAARLAEWIARIVEEQPKIGIPLREVLAQNSLLEDDEFLEAPLQVPRDRQFRAGQHFLDARQLSALLKRRFGIDELGDAKVQELDNAAGSHQHVRGPDVPMDNEAGMRVGDGSENVHEQSNSRACGERASFAVFVYMLPIDELED